MELSGHARSVAVHETPPWLLRSTIDRPVAGAEAGRRASRPLGSLGYERSTQISFALRARCTYGVPHADYEETYV